MKRFLITTADERSWRFDRPALFLGEWCRIYQRKHIWAEMNATVARSYGLEHGQKEQNQTYVQELAEKLLVELTATLNLYHGVDHTVRYWHIVLGHWLQRYVALLFNRYHALKQALDENDVDGTVIFDLPDYHLATIDSLSFIWAANDHIWNHVLYSKILCFWAIPHIERVPRSIENLYGFKAKAANKSDVPNGARKTFAKFVLGLQKFSKKDDAFILNSYLPFSTELQLQGGMGQVPQIWRTPVVESVLPNRQARQRLAMETQGYSGFELFVRQQLSEMIPTCYIEGYGLLDSVSKALPWPKNPEFIFTSNNFDTDEVFKVWAASMAEQGVPYFIGQHGSNYGTLLVSKTWSEMIICDRFFTWGWTNHSPKNIPAFVFNIAGRKLIQRNPEGGLLLIELHAPHRLVPEDSYFEFSTYQDEQFQFAEALPEIIKKELTVRLYGGHGNFFWAEEQRWKDRCPDIRLETGQANIRDLIANSRLVVYSYDSTGFLETLALNTPTMCFWRGPLDHLLPEARPYYGLLQDAGILHDSPEQAAELIAQRWHNINKWWDSPEVQTARKLFCEQYARVENKPVKTLKKLLREQAAEVRKKRDTAQVEGQSWN